MTHIAGFERDQLLLLPEAMDDYVDAHNPVRFIDAFVDGLDLAVAGFSRVVAKATGRPGYAPGDLLKLYIYGYLNRARSSRRLEREAHRNIEVIWLLRSLRPDFKTIADFRRDNAKAFRAVFRQLVLAANCSPSTEPASRQSTTRIATSPAVRCASSSAPPTSGWMIISRGSTRATSKTARRPAGRARKISPRRSKPCARSAAVTRRCWLSLTEPARTRSR
jgi:transposase